MDEFYFQRSHVPAFGSWDCYNDLPFTQCFDSARALGYAYSEDRDLYVAGDLYENDILTPAVIVVPRSRPGKTGHRKEKEKEGKKEHEWVTCQCERDVAHEHRAEAPKKAVDEDLYKISPHLLRQPQQQQPKRRRAGWGIFASCLQPTCVY